MAIDNGWLTLIQLIAITNQYLHGTSKDTGQPSIDNYWGKTFKVRTTVGGWQILGEQDIATPDDASALMSLLIMLDCIPMM